MQNKHLLILIIAALCMALSGCHQEPEVTLRTTQCASLPQGRASACACVCEGKAYVFGGRDASKKYLNDLWEYDPQTDKWTNLGAAPMKARVQATMASCGDKIYVGLGYSAQRAYTDSAYQQDWYEYTPATGQWKQLKNYPNTYTVAAISFEHNGSIYAIYGFWYAFSRYICRYDIATDSWATYPDDYHRAKVNFGGNGVLFDGLLYYGGGYNTYNLTQWFKVDIEKDQWTAGPSIPGKGREWMACAASKEYIYLFGGRHFAGEMTGGEVFDSYLRYAPAKDQWEWCGKMPCGRAENQIAFSIDGQVYFGLGEDENGKVMGSLYRVES